jgi:hypothetical protein
MTQSDQITFIKENLTKMEKNITQEITYGVEAVQAKVIEDARVICPTGVTGALSQSIQPGPITITGDNVEATVEVNSDYASYVEWGTRPHFPPIDALKDWAAKFLGDPRLAFIVARAIARRGTHPYNFMGQSILANMSVFVDAVAAGVRRGIEESAS